MPTSVGLIRSEASCAGNEVPGSANVHGVNQAGADGIGVTQGKRLSLVIQIWIGGEQKIAVEKSRLSEMSKKVSSEDSLLLVDGPIDAANELIFILRLRYSVDQLAARIGSLGDVL